MIVFYQIRSHFHKTVDLPNETCSSCNNRGTLKMHFLQQYAWIFGPLMPGKKFATIQCDVCNEKLPNKLWTKELDAIYKQEKKTINTPFRMWRGMIFMLLLFIIPYSLMKMRILNPMNLKRVNQSEDVNKTNVKNCKEGDVLFVSINKYTETSASTDRFTLAKILKIEGDKTTIKIYTDNYEFMNQYDLALSDLDNSKFKEEIEIKTESLRRFGNLIYYNPPSEKMKFIAFGYARSVIQE